METVTVSFDENYINPLPKLRNEIKPKKKSKQLNKCSNHYKKKE